MKRFALFGGQWYYPSGGWEDFIDSYDTAEEAAAYCQSDDGAWSSRWFHVVDMTTGKVVAKGSYDSDPVNDEKPLWKVDVGLDPHLS